MWCPFILHARHVVGQGRGITFFQNSKRGYVIREALREGDSRTSNIPSIAKTAISIDVGVVNASVGDTTGDKVGVGAVDVA